MSAVIKLAEVLQQTCISTLGVDTFSLPIDQLKGTMPTESIDFSKKGLYMASAVVIAACITGNKHLKQPNLSSNRLGVQPRPRVGDMVRVTAKKDERFDLIGQVKKDDKSDEPFLLAFADAPARSDGQDDWFGADDVVMLHSASPLSVLAKVLPDTKIETLDLAETTPTNRGEDMSAVFKLVEVLPQTKIESLNLARNDITNRGKDMSAVIKLTEVLAQTKIESLNLANNGMCAEGTAALANVLSQTQIKELNLEYNGMGAEGTAALANVLSQTQIKDLNLASNGIDPGTKDKLRSENPNIGFTF